MELSASWKWDLWFSLAFQAGESTITVQELIEEVYKKSDLLEHQLFLLRDSTKKVRNINHGILESWNYFGLKGPLRLLSSALTMSIPKSTFYWSTNSCQIKGKSSWTITGKKIFPETRGNSLLCELKPFSSLLQIHLWRPLATERKCCHIIPIQQTPRRVVTSCSVLWWEGNCAAAAHQAQL